MAGFKGLNVRNREDVCNIKETLQKKKLKFKETPKEGSLENILSLNLFVFVVDKTKDVPILPAIDV